MDSLMVHGNYMKKNVWSWLLKGPRQKYFRDQGAYGIHAAKMEFLSGRVDRNEPSWLAVAPANDLERIVHYGRRTQFVDNKWLPSTSKEKP